MATTTVSNEYVLKAIENLEVHVIQTKTRKKEGFEEREQAYNGKRKYVSWLVTPYCDTWAGISDENAWYYYGEEELDKAEKLKALIKLSPDGVITIDDDDASMIDLFNSLKVGDGNE